MTFNDSKPTLSCALYLPAVPETQEITSKLNSVNHKALSVIRISAVLQNEIWTFASLFHYEETKRTIKNFIGHKIRIILSFIHINCYLLISKHIISVGMMIRVIIISDYPLSTVNQSFFSWRETFYAASQLVDPRINLNILYLEHMRAYSFCRVLLENSIFLDFLAVSLILSRCAYTGKCIPAQGYTQRHAFAWCMSVGGR